ncbi:MAG: MinD/ParA family protein [bacterium]
MSTLEKSDSKPKGPVIWAVGGGKGGVGKSVITSNLAISLAQRGKRCIAIDADLGGANLHTVIGMPNPKYTLSAFLRREVDNLHEIIAPTPIPNLWLISGARALMEMANPKYTQKEKLLRHISKLDADYVILDLGSGTSFNILDFFLVAQEGILVVLPEPTSVENAYHFIKAAFYRKLKRATNRTGVTEAIDRVMVEKIARGIQSPRALIENVHSVNRKAGEALQVAADNFRPNIIINMVRRWDDKDLGQDISVACKDYFGITVEFVGEIEDDDHVKKAIRMRKSVMGMFPASPFTKSIHKISRNLLSHDGDSHE